MDTKYIFVMGGVCSGLGKGIATASIGAILKAAGYRVSVLKLDPYINVDPGTMSPFQHGEVFVTDDGYESDLDLGHYERFIDEPLSRLSNITTGQIYQKIIADERHGTFLGRTIQIVPHVTGIIKEKIKEITARTQADFIIIEIGGTVGDIEGEPYLEAARQFHREIGSGRVMFVLMTLLPYLATSGELKTKPTQMAVRELHRVGIQPDIILARSDLPIPAEALEKIAAFSDTPLGNVIPAPTIKSIYEVPINFERSGMSGLIYKHFGIDGRTPNLEEWERLVANIQKSNGGALTIAVVGKYVGHGDAYISVYEALKSAAAYHAAPLEIVSIDSEKLENADDEAWQVLAEADGLLVPGGFGHRGIEGKINAVRAARERKLPYLGLCLGMQVMSVEFGRHVLKTNEVNSSEFDTSVAHDIIHIMPDQREKIADHEMGATMRLGAYPCHVVEGTRSFRAYTDSAPHAVPSDHAMGGVRISERHRHRYEFNNKYRQRLEEAGMIFSGVNSERNLVEIIELRDHPFMVGVQFHPEFQSRPLKPHPLFRDFVAAALRHKSNRLHHDNV